MTGSVPPDPPLPFSSTLSASSHIVLAIGLVPETVLHLAQTARRPEIYAMFAPMPRS